MVFYFITGVERLPPPQVTPQVTYPCQSFVFSFPALFRALSTETAVGELEQRQHHHGREMETNTSLMGR